MVRTGGIGTEVDFAAGTALEALLPRSDAEHVVDGDHEDVADALGHKLLVVGEVARNVRGAWSWSHLCVSFFFGPPSVHPSTRPFWRAGKDGESRKGGKGVKGEGYG